MKKDWRKKIKNDLPPGGAELNSFHPVVANILYSRGIRGGEQARDFFNPQYEKLHDPFLLRDMEPGVKRILEAIKQKERITVYADYDADAVTAAAVLLRFFQKIGYRDVNYYIPDRFSEGYGVNSEAVKKLCENGTRLFVTVDCGISAFEAVAEAKIFGADFIITDHHLPSDHVPDAVAVINPHRTDDSYPFKDLTGVGVAFKLVQALIKSGLVEVEPGWEKWLLDLVAIGTVADCQSLLGENRILVKWGLVVLGKTKWKGLRALIDSSGIDPSKPLDTYHVGFIIAPRLNAAGRIKHAGGALELLLTDNVEEAKRLAAELEEQNRHRQALTEQVLSEAREQITPDDLQKVILVSGTWPKGVIGLVAGKLAEEFFRPAFVVSTEEGEAVGSARGIPGLDLVDMLEQSREFLLRYGGHKMAAGFSLSPENLGQFRSRLMNLAGQFLNGEKLVPYVEYDAELGLDEVDDALVNSLERFAPFGQDNPKPKVRVRGEVISWRTVGEDGRHLRFFLGASRAIGAIGFNFGYIASELNMTSDIELIGELQFNEWNGTRSIQLRVVDLHLLPAEKMSAVDQQKEMEYNN